MIGVSIVLVFLIVGTYCLLSWDIYKSKERSDEGRRNLHQRISTLETSLGELTTSTDNTNHFISQQDQRIAELQKDLDAATERMDLVAEVLRPTVVEGE